MQGLFDGGTIRAHDKLFSGPLGFSLWSLEVPA
jgi:hypothetical protein